MYNFIIKEDNKAEYTVVNGVNYYKSHTYHHDGGVDASWRINRDENASLSEEQYFVFETEYSGGFAHWIHECMIFIDTYITLKKEKYPNLKIVAVGDFNYKKIFFNFFNIPLTDVVPSIIPKRTCIFTPVICLMTLNKNLKDYFIEKTTTLFNTLTKDLDNTQNIPITFLPRQTRENFPVNDRRITYIGIEEAVKNKEGVVYHTDLVKDLKEQMQIVRSSKVLICDYGSSFFVNGMFANNATIYVLYNMKNHEDYMLYGAVYDIICSKNKVIFIFDGVANYVFKKEQIDILN